MKGLLLKDWKTLLKQMKVMLAITTLLACVPGTYLSAFALFYAAMKCMIFLWKTATNRGNLCYNIYRSNPLIKRRDTSCRFVNFRD